MSLPADLYWRVHPPERPFDPEDATSTPFHGPYPTQMGYSAFANPWHLFLYLDANNLYMTALHQQIIGFSGTSVGEGADGEDLVLPDMRTVRRFAMAEWEAQLATTPLPDSPKFSDKWTGRNNDYLSWAKTKAMFQDEEHGFSLGGDPVIDVILKAAAGQQLYFHVGRQGLPVGTQLIPGGPGGRSRMHTGPVRDEELLDWVWLSQDADTACNYALYVQVQLGTEPSIYLARPTDRIEERTGFYSGSDLPQIITKSAVVVAAFPWPYEKLRTFDWITWWWHQNPEAKGLLPRDAVLWGVLEDWRTAISRGLSLDLPEIGVLARKTAENDYRGQHAAPSDGPPLHDLLAGHLFPDDVYDYPERYAFGDYAAASAKLVLKVRNKPDAMVTIYRAVPPNVGATTINTGDWVSIVKGYAKDHGRGRTWNEWVEPADPNWKQDPSVITNKEAWQTRRGNWTLLEATVPASQIRSGGNDIVEWGYWGPPVAALGAKTAAWRDVRNKAREIRSGGGVKVIAVAGDTITAEVKSTTDSVYQTSLLREPGTHNVAMWECSCPWAAYSWGRSGRWKKYEGRMCAHALALVYEAQAQEWGGRNVTEGEGHGEEITFYEAPPIGDWRLDTPVPAPSPYDNMGRAAAKADTLAAIIEGFTPIAQSHGWDSPAEAEGMCITAEYAFRTWLAEHFPTVSYRDWYVDVEIPGWITNDYLFGAQNHNIPLVSFDQGATWTVVDWTFRQFVPDSPFPMVEPEATALARWKRHEEFNRMIAKTAVATGEKGTRVWRGFLSWSIYGPDDRPVAERVELSDHDLPQNQALAQRFHDGTVTAQDLLKIVALDSAGLYWAEAGPHASEGGRTGEEVARSYAGGERGIWPGHGGVDETNLLAYSWDERGPAGTQWEHEYVHRGIGTAMIVLVAELAEDAAGFDGEGMLELDEGQPLNLLEIQYNAGWGWHTVPIGGRRITAARKTAYREVSIEELRSARQPFITLCVPQTFSGWKAHIYCETVDDVMMAYHRIKGDLLLEEAEELGGWGAKVATQAFFDLIPRDHKQWGKGVTVYFPQRAKVHGEQGDIDWLKRNMAGWPDRLCQRIQGDDYYGNGVGVRFEFSEDPGEDVDIYRYNELYRAAALNEYGQDPDRTGTDLGYNDGYQDGIKWAGTHDPRPSWDYPISDGRDDYYAIGFMEAVTARWCPIHPWAEMQATGNRCLGTWPCMKAVRELVQRTWDPMERGTHFDQLDMGFAARKAAKDPRFQGVTLDEDDDGFYVRTHRARSDSYPGPEHIPQSVVDYIESTGSLKTAAADYMMSHRPNEDGPPAYDLLADGAEWGAPPDIYDHPNWYVGDPGSVSARETIRALKAIRGNTNATVTIYRSSPSSAFNTGDWVSLSRNYAKESGLDPFDEGKDLPVHAIEVPAHQVRWAGDDLNEFGYWGPPTTGRTAARTATRAIMYHLTDDVDFRLDPNFHPENNTTWGGDWPHAGIFLGGSVESWVNGYGYWRPWVVEFDTSAVDFTAEHAMGGGGYSGEVFVPADQFDRLRLVRVVPLDAHCREEFGDYGWTERDTGLTFDTFEPIPAEDENNYFRWRGYRYPGDARQADAAWRDAYERRVKKFGQGHPGAIAAKQATRGLPFSDMWESTSIVFWIVARAPEGVGSFSSDFPRDLPMAFQKMSFQETTDWPGFLNRLTLKAKDSVFVRDHGDRLQEFYLCAEGRGPVGKSEQWVIGQTDYEGFWRAEPWDMPTRRLPGGYSRDWEINTQFLNHAFYDNPEAFRKYMAEELAGVSIDDSMFAGVSNTEPTVVYRGIALPVGMDPLNSTTDRHEGVGHSWSLSFDAACRMAERNGAGFNSDNRTVDGYLFNALRPNDDYVPTVLRATVVIDGAQIDTYRPWTIDYASEQEVDIPTGTPITIDGYMQARPIIVSPAQHERAKLAEDRYSPEGYYLVRFDWPSNFSGANKRTTAMRTTAARNNPFGMVIDAATGLPHLHGQPVFIYPTWSPDAGIADFIAENGPLGDFTASYMSGDGTTVLRGMTLSLSPSEGLSLDMAQRLVSGQGVTPQDILRFLINDRAGIWWMRNDGLDLGDIQDQYADVSDMEPLSKALAEYDADVSGADPDRWYREMGHGSKAEFVKKYDLSPEVVKKMDLAPDSLWYGGDIGVVLEAHTPKTKDTGELWDPETMNPDGGLMGNSYLPEGLKLGLVAIHYNAGNGWRTLPAEGIRVTTSKTAYSYGGDAVPVEDVVRKNGYTEGRVQASPPVYAYRGFGSWEEMETARMSGMWFSEGMFSIDGEGDLQMALHLNEVLEGSDYFGLRRTGFVGIAKARINGLYFQTLESPVEYDEPRSRNSRGDTEAKFHVDENGDGYLIPDLGLGIGILTGVPFDRIQEIYVVENQRIVRTISPAELDERGVEDMGLADNPAWRPVLKYNQETWTNWVGRAWPDDKKMHCAPDQTRTICDKEWVGGLYRVLSPTEYATDPFTADFYPKKFCAKCFEQQGEWLVPRRAIGTTAGKKISLGDRIKTAQIEAADPLAGLKDVLETIDSGDHTHSGLIIKAIDSGRVLMTQRTPYAEDPEGVYGRWEFPGGGIGEGEDAFTSALREFREETGLELPEDWAVEGCYENKTYLGIVVLVPGEAWTTNAELLSHEVMGVGWFHPDLVQDTDLAREEVDAAEWDMIKDASLHDSGPGLPGTDVVDARPMDAESSGQNERGVIARSDGSHVSFAELGLWVGDAPQVDLPPLGGHVGHVVGGGPEEPVAGVAARRVVAGVQDEEAAWVTDEVLVAPPMGSYVARTTARAEGAIPEAPVPIGEAGGRPGVAGIRAAAGVDLGEPSFFGGGHGGDFTSQIDGSDIAREEVDKTEWSMIREAAKTFTGYHWTKSVNAADIKANGLRRPAQDPGAPERTDVVWFSDTPDRIDYAAWQSDADRHQFSLVTVHIPADASWAIGGPMEGYPNPDVSFALDQAVPPSWIISVQSYDEYIAQGGQVVATLHDEPEPALPSTDGSAEEVEDLFSPAAIAQRAAALGEDDSDIAAAANAYLAKTAVKVFSPKEQMDLIEEGAVEGVTAANLDRLDIEGTHYEQLEERYRYLDGAEAAAEDLFL